VLDLLKTLRKDNSGYRLKDLFVGSEGTLGVITKVALQVYPLCPPELRQVAVIPVDSINEAIKVLMIAREKLNRNLSAFEYMDNASLYAVHEMYPQITRRLKQSSADEEDCGFVLIETNESNTVNTWYIILYSSFLVTYNFNVVLYCIMSSFDIFFHEIESSGILNGIDRAILASSIQQHEVFVIIKLSAVF